jgi:hypothetical protein
MYRRYHACVLDLPAAETLHMQSQLRVRLESGETAAPPDSMYLLPVELTDRPVGAGAAAASGGAGGGGDDVRNGSPQGGEVKPPIAAAAGAAGPKGGRSGMGAPSIGIDEVSRPGCCCCCFLPLAGSNV